MYHIAEKLAKFSFFEHLATKVWQTNESNNWLLIVSTNLDDFSFTNLGYFIKLSSYAASQAAHIKGR